MQKQAGTKTAIVAVLFAALNILPGIASAHTGVDAGAHHGFFQGFMHPFMGIDHLAAMLAVGLWSALAARRAMPDLLWAPLGFVAALAVGAWIGLSGIDVPAVEPMIAASLLVTGLLVVTRLRVPGIAASILIGAFAVFHGVAHGHELAGESNAFVTMIGMIAATAVLHVAGIAIGWTLRHRNAWISRAAGGAVVGLGAVLLTPLMTQMI